MFEFRATPWVSSNFVVVFSVVAWNSVYASGFNHIGNRSASFLQPISRCMEAWLGETNFIGVLCAWILNLIHLYVLLIHMQTVHLCRNCGSWVLWQAWFWWSARDKCIRKVGIEPKHVAVAPSTLKMEFYVRGSVRRESMSITVQQDATVYSLLYFSLALHVSDGNSTHYQEHI
jgi:hypothetical protein